MLSPYQHFGVLKYDDKKKQGMLISFKYLDIQCKQERQNMSIKYEREDIFQYLQLYMSLVSRRMLKALASRVSVIGPSRTRIPDTRDL